MIISASGIDIDGNWTINYNATIAGIVNCTHLNATGTVTTGTVNCTNLNTTGTVNRTNLNTTGNVGIGTNVPYATVHVNEKMTIKTGNTQVAPPSFDSSGGIGDIFVRMGHRHRIRYH